MQRHNEIEKNWSFRHDNYVYRPNHIVDANKNAEQYSGQFFGSDCWLLSQVKQHSKVEWLCQYLEKETTTIIVNVRCVTKEDTVLWPTNVVYNIIDLVNLHIMIVDIV